MKVTVIVPVYNGEEHLVQCLESLVNQTMDSLDILVINDGSTDKTESIIKDYTEKYTNIRSINQTNKGLFETRRIALDFAKGDYIGWVDADDFVELNMFEVLYQAAIQNQSELTYCDYQFYPDKISTKEKWFRTYEGNLSVDFIERNNQPWNKLVKKTLLIDLNIGELFPKCFDEAYIKVLLNAKNPISISQKLYYYRVGEGSMSTSYSNVKHYEKFIDSSKVLLSELEGYSDYWDQYFQYRVYYYMLMTLLVAATNDNREVYNKYKKLLFKDKFWQNRHLNHILKTNFGFVKFIAIKYFVPSHFYVARLLGKHSLG